MTKTGVYAIIAVFVVFLAAFLVVTFIYQSTDFYTFFEAEGNYLYDRGILIESSFEDEDFNKNALVYRSLKRAFESLELKQEDISQYGLDNKVFKYYILDGYVIPLDPAYKGFIPVSTADKLVYMKDGKKYHLNFENKSYAPLWAGSISGVDEFAEDVAGFSSNGEYSASLTKDLLVIYHRPEIKNYAIKEIKEISLSEYKATSFEFLGFLNQRHLWFSLETQNSKEYFICDASTGILEKTALSAEVEFYDKLYSNIFLMKKPTNEDLADETYYIIRWENAVLGKKYSAKLKKSLYSEVELLNISTEGNYAAVRVRNNDGAEEILICSGKKNHSLSEYITDAKINDVAFVYDNVIFVSLEKDGAKIARGITIKF